MDGVEKSRKEIPVDVHRLHLGDAQPLGGKVFNKVFRPFIGQKSPRLNLDHIRIAQLAFGGQVKQLLVWHASPEEIGQPRSEFILLGRRAISDDSVIEKLRRDKHSGQGLTHRLLERVELGIVDFVNGVKMVDFVSGDGSAECPFHESLDHLISVLACIGFTQR